MTLLGCRVVRGPDWKWSDQDGGEGSVGTIVSLEKFAEGRRLPSKTVLVRWDAGTQADYRAGLNGCYDLRVYDSSSAGVVFPAFTCDGCMQAGITGIRWHCSMCNDFDLCNVCYMNDVHEKDHAFVRYHISRDRVNGKDVGTRFASTKIRSKGMFPGAKVKPRQNSPFYNDLNTIVGNVSGISAWKGTPRSAVLVNWMFGDETSHRLGFEGEVDLSLVEAANGPFYYKDHLPVVSLDDKAWTASTGGESLRVGDMVKVELDVETLKQMLEGHGGWVPAMEKTIGQIGKVVQIDEDGDVYVSYGALKWAFHPEALCKVTTSNLRVGDKVRVINNKEIVIQLQEGHGGWNDSMQNTLGKMGKVIRVVSGDMVVSIESRVWVFNPNALILESKEGERLAPGEGGPFDNGSTSTELLLRSMFEELLSNAGASGSEMFGNLLVATTVGNVDNVKRIIGKNKSLVNQKFPKGKTPLLIACHQGKGDIVSFLLENGANKEAKDDEGYTALHHAAYGDKSGMCVVLMLSANANVNARDLKGTKVTPLHLAVQRGNEAPVTALVQSKHCDVNCQDIIGDTPLHEAILRGHNTIFSKLLKAHNMDPTICNGSGFNILHLASLKNNKHAVKLLIDKYPGLVDIPKEDGFAALHITALNNHHEIARELILSGHCSVNMRNHEGMTALALSVTRSYKDMIELLIEHGVDLNEEDKDGDTPLHVAVMKHCIKFIGLDLSSLSPNTPSSDNNNVNTEKAISIFLVKRGADISYKNHQGKTPLDLCIDKDLEEIMKRQYSIRNAPPLSPCMRASTPRKTGPPSTISAVPNRTPPTLPSSPTSPVKPVSPQPVTKPPTDASFIPPPPSFLLRGNEAIAKPVDSTTMAAVPMPAASKSAETAQDLDIPVALSNMALRDDKYGSNSASASSKQEKRDPNLDIESEIKASDKKTKAVESQNANEEDEQCRYCLEEIAVVVFKPCEHKVVCEGCSMRARVCLQCNTKISSKLAPGEIPIKTLGDVKKDYEIKMRELQKKHDEMERIAICQICMDNESNVVFRPCGHKSCGNCAKKLYKCHSCKEKIEERITTYQ